MARKPREHAENTRLSQPPPRSPEARERRLMNAALDLAEKQILDGTASSQVITHFLKLSSSREQLEQERLARENEFLKIRAEALAAAQRQDELYSEAIRAFKSYNTFSSEPDGDYGD